nr:exodeoxyribonuclease VII small subunit [uncultured Caproiciproducens sp.]
MNKKMTFEDAMAKLSEIVNQLENGNESLENSLKLFEEGSALASLCYGKLENAEQKIRQITEFEEAGGEKNA